MSHIQIELSDEEDDILRTYMWLAKENNKRQALKGLVRYSKKIKEINEAIKILDKMEYKK